jgi:hypothetical protein
MQCESSAAMKPSRVTSNYTDKETEPAKLLQDTSGSALGYHVADAELDHGGERHDNPVWVHQVTVLVGHADGWVEGDPARNTCCDSRLILFMHVTTGRRILPLINLLAYAVCVDQVMTVRHGGLPASCSVELTVRVWEWLIRKSWAGGLGCADVHSRSV